MFQRFAACLLLAAPAFAAARDAGSFLRDLIDLETLTQVEGAPMKMESSWDRGGGNDDGFRRERVSGGVYTIARLQGPGVVRRMWTARPRGQLRIYIDGAAKPVIDVPCEEFFAGSRAPFERPLNGPMGGGNYSFFPIPYSKSIVIQIAALPSGGQEPFGAYHHVAYQTFPENTEVVSLRLPLAPPQEEERQRVLAAWRNPGQPPAPKPGASTRVEKTLAVPAGSAATLLDLSGAGMIREFRLRLAGKDPDRLRKTILRIRWDSQEQFAVNCPAGDFFGNGFSQVPFRSLPMGLESGTYYTYLPMPFGARAEVMISNESDSQPVQVSVQAAWERRDSLPAGTGYFHAKWRREDTAGIEAHEKNLTGRYNYAILDVEGAGRFIGANLNVFNRHLLWWGEGDPMIFVDEDAWPPSMHGTGTEEYFNDAWGFHDFIEAPGGDPARKERNVIPLSGVLLAGLSAPGRCFGANAIFNFHVPDSFAFRQRIRVSIEHGTENNLSNDYASTAYWYAAAGSRDFFQPRPAYERAAPPPGQWEDLRRQAIARTRVSLRRQILETASLLDRFPTDVQRHPRRVRVLRQVFQLAREMELPPTEVKRLQARMDAARKRPLPERFPLFDSIYRDLAGIVGSLRGVDTAPPIQ